MTQRTTPPYRADHVGSFLRPKALLDAREQAQAGAIPRAELRKVEDAAIRDIVKFQEDLGLQGITDGEFRRTYFHIDFLEQLDGVETRGGITAKFHGEGGRRELRAAGDARHRQGAPRAADPARRLRVPEVGHEARAEGDHPVADDAALPRRPRRDQQGGLSRPRGVLRRRRRRLPRRAEAARRRRLPVRPARRHQPRVPLRSRSCARAPSPAATTRTSCRAATRS